mmetsp:Transcript_92968/g.189390  ORF Transcript_92968/g.189390 Transcript_92968/m.189390 type:complete len:237 (-) Transcript_92968:18-728(-)
MLMFFSFMLLMNSLYMTPCNLQFAFVRMIQSARRSRLKSFRDHFLCFSALMTAGWASLYSFLSRPAKPPAYFSHSSCFLIFAYGPSGCLGAFATIFAPRPVLSAALLPRTAKRRFTCNGHRSPESLLRPFPAAAPEAGTAPARATWRWSWEAALVAACLATCCLPKRRATAMRVPVAARIREKPPEGGTLGPAAPRRPSAVGASGPAACGGGRRSPAPASGAAVAGQLAAAKAGAR